MTTVHAHLHKILSKRRAAELAHRKQAAAAAELAATAANLDAAAAAAAKMPASIQSPPKPKGALP